MGAVLHGFGWQTASSNDTQQLADMPHTQEERAQCRKFVRGRQAETLCTQHGQHALAQFRKQYEDVILCDLQMSDLNGLAFYDILTSRYPSLRQRAVFLTGATMRADSTAFLAAMWATVAAEALPWPGPSPAPCRSRVCVKRLLLRGSRCPAWAAAAGLGRGALLTG